MDKEQAKKVIRWMRAVEEKNKRQIWPQLIMEVLEKKKGRNEDEVTRLYESVKGVEVYIGLYHVLRNGLGMDEEEEEEEEDEVQIEAMEDDEESKESASNSEQEDEEEGEDGEILDYKGFKKALSVGRKAINRPQVKKALREQEARALNGILDLNDEIFTKKLAKEGKGVLNIFFKSRKEQEEEEEEEEDTEEGGQSDNKKKKKKETNKREREDEMTEDITEEDITEGVEERKQGEQGNSENNRSEKSKRKRRDNNDEWNAYRTPEQVGQQTRASL